MKKIYFFCFASLVSWSTMAQKFNGKPMKNGQINAPATNVAPALIQIENANKTQAQLDTIWKENFATGGTALPSGWTAGGTDLFWRRVSKVSANDCYEGFNTNLNAPTQANGFLLFDADSANTAQYGCPNTGSWTTRTGYVTSPTINLTGKSNVSISLYWLARNCCAVDTSVFVFSISNDNGATWKNFSISGQLAVNKYNTNHTFTKNISAIAGNKSQVKLRFSTKLLSGYFVQLDDVILYETPSNDMALYAASMNFTQFEVRYTQTPKSQVDTIWFNALAVNNGSATQSNVKLNVALFNGASTVYATNTGKGTRSSASIVADKMDTLVAYFAVPKMVATYTATYSITQIQTDQVPNNMSFVRTFAITDSVYARDIADGNGTGLLNYAPCSWRGCAAPQVPGDMVGNQFLTFSDDKATSMSFYLHDSTQVGSSVTGKIFAWNGSAWAELAATDPYDVDIAAKKNKWVTLPFFGGPITLPADADMGYLVAVEFNTAKRAYIGGEQRDEVGATGWAYYVSDATWYWDDVVASAIRLNFNYALGIDEKKNGVVKLAQNMPNPTNGTTTINYSLTESTNVLLDIYDITGKKVMNVVNERIAAGTHNISINTTSLDAGVYFYRLTAGNNSVTQKMTVVK